VTSANTISIAPVEAAWAVMLIDGRELARFSGPGAKRKTLRYAASTTPVRRHPSIEAVRRVREERGARRVS
jgi:hypothetical protein